MCGKYLNKGQLAANGLLAAETSALRSYRYIMKADRMK
jgi:hypothetical protein